MTEGRIVELRPANAVSAGHREDWLPAPQLGEHTVEVLREAGFSPARIDAMIQEGSARSSTTPD